MITALVVLITAGHRLVSPAQRRSVPGMAFQYQVYKSMLSQYHTPQAVALQIKHRGFIPL